MSLSFRESILRHPDTLGGGRIPKNKEVVLVGDTVITIGQKTKALLNILLENNYLEMQKLQALLGGDIPLSTLYNRLNVLKAKLEPTNYILTIENMFVSLQLKEEVKNVEESYLTQFSLNIVQQNEEITISTDDLDFTITFGKKGESYLFGFFSSIIKYIHNKGYISATEMNGIYYYFYKDDDHNMMAHRLKLINMRFAILARRTKKNQKIMLDTIRDSTGKIDVYKLKFTEI